MANHRPPTHTSSDGLCFLGSRSFVHSTLGFTAVAFVTGSLALWAPTFLFRAAVFTGRRPPCFEGNCADSERSEASAFDCSHYTHRPDAVSLPSV